MSSGCRAIRGRLARREMSWCVSTPCAHAIRSALPCPGTAPRAQASSIDRPPVAAAAGGKHSVAAQRADPRSMLALYRRLLALRHERPGLSTGELRVLRAEDGTLYYERPGTPGHAIIARLSDTPPSSSCRASVASSSAPRTSTAASQAGPSSRRSARRASSSLSERDARIRAHGSRSLWPPWIEADACRNSMSPHIGGCRGSSGAWRCARTLPARQPGARPPAGGRINSTSSPVRAISQEMIEFEFHISPARSSSRPQTGVGTSGTSSSSRRARSGSSLRRCGLSTASPRSGMTPSRQRRTS
jgi:Domain of unknown function (DUF3459)